MQVSADYFDDVFQKATIQTRKKYSIVIETVQLAERIKAKDRE